MREVQTLEFARRVREIHQRLRSSQKESAQRFGTSLRSLQEWEQARQLPDLSRVSEGNPKAVQSL